jgi:cell division protein FtsB
MKWFAAALVAALLLLQYRLWLSSDGVRDVRRLQAQVVAQQQQNASLAERNRELAAEVHDLKHGYAALEERARADLGMIAGNETFYQVVPTGAAAAHGAAGAAGPAGAAGARGAVLGAAGRPAAGAHAGRRAPGSARAAVVNAAALSVPPLSAAALPPAAAPGH